MYPQVTCHGYPAAGHRAAVPGVWFRTPATGPTSLASARSAAGPVRGSGRGRGRPRPVRGRIARRRGGGKVGDIRGHDEGGAGAGNPGPFGQIGGQRLGTAPWGRTIIGRRSRRRYQSSTAATASGSGRPGSPSGRAELARPVKPAGRAEPPLPQRLGLRRLPVQRGGALEVARPAGSWAQAFAGSEVPGPRRRTRTRSRRCSGRVRSAAPSTVKPASAIISRSRAPAWPSLVR